MASQLCVSVGEARVHLDQLVAAVTTAEGYSLSREQWVAFAMAVIQALLGMFGTVAPPAPTEQLPPEPGLKPELTGPPRPDRPRPR